MEVDLDVTDAPDKAVSTDVSTQNEKQIECVTTNNAIDLAHNSPITEYSAADEVDDEILSHIRRHTGCVQEYPRRIEQGTSEKHLCHSSSNG